MDSYVITYYAGIAALFSYGLYRLSRVGMRPKGYPPGPPTKPIIGNLHLIDKDNWHLQLQKWAEEYGPIYSVKYGSRDLIVLTSDVIVRDLFDKRSGIYSGRQDIYLNQIWHGLNPIMRSNDDTWRMQRKLYHGMLTVKTFNKYIPYQDLENIKMLLDLIRDPSDFRYHIRRYSTSLTTTMVYGWRTPTYDVPYVNEMFEGMEEFFKLIQHSLLYDWYPVLRPLTRMLPDWMVPGQRRAKYLFNVEKKVFLKCWEAAEKENERGMLVPCLCKDIMNVQEKDGFSNLMAAFVAGLAFEGGSDTTAQTLYGFVKAMACFSEAQKKAQEELERVVGPDRLPSVEDEESLPYIRCCIKEILRWMPINLTGVAHAPSQDDEYMGYKIPKGAGVIINVWAMHHDPKRHPNPREYYPDRYANDHKRAYESATTADPTQRDHFGFGSGRRMCPGLNVAERSLFLGIARMLWAFNITKAKDANGNEIPIDRDAIEVSQSACPKPFKCSILPRDHKRVELIEKIWAEKELLLDAKGQYKSTDNFG